MSLGEALAQAWSVFFPQGLERCQGITSGHVMLMLLSVYLLARLVQAEYRLAADAAEGCLVCSQQKKEPLRASVEDLHVFV
jgi:hypothetical protein